jgi:hypothetical protein
VNLGAFISRVFPVDVPVSRSQTRSFQADYHSCFSA